MIALCCKEHILLCVIVNPTIKAKHLNLIVEYLVSCLTLNTVHGQEQSKRLLKSKSSFQDFIENGGLLTRISHSSGSK